MEFYRKGNSFLILLFVLFFLSAVLFELQFQQFISRKFLVLNNQTISPEKAPLLHAYEPPKKLANPPEIIKAVYVTGWSAGRAEYLNYLDRLFTNTEINAVVIDIKDYSGLVSYNSSAPEVKKYNLTNYAISDIDNLVRYLHSRNVYVIGRISVFEDPAYSKARPELAIYDEQKTIDSGSLVLWQDNNKLSWLDPASKDMWGYDVSLAKDAFLHGFDEMNFDYIRFPSDGNVENMGFPVWDPKKLRAEVIKEFFNYLRTSLAGEKISVDLFGQTTTNTDDMGIGQVIENAFENFDYVCPMIYPSHYVDGFLSFNNPAEHPYEIVNYSLNVAIARELKFLDAEHVATENNIETVSSAIASPFVSAEPPLAKFRPWLQDFNMGADYTADMVKAEIRAVEDALGKEYNGFMLWNSSNIYTQGAVFKPLSAE